MLGIGENHVVGNIAFVQMFWIDVGVAKVTTAGYGCGQKKTGEYMVKFSFHTNKFLS